MVTFLLVVLIAGFALMAHHASGHADAYAFCVFSLCAFILSTFIIPTTAGHLFLEVTPYPNGGVEIPLVLYRPPQS